MAAGTKTGGRNPGAQNKTTTTAKENMIAVFEAMGGRKTMTNWANENPTEFYRLYGKLIPLQVSGEGGGAIDIVVRVVPHDDNRQD